LNLGRIEDLAELYERQIGTSWQQTMPGSQRVIILCYDKELERSLRIRVGEFEQATQRSGHVWKLVDCTDWFAKWMVQEDYRDAYFEDQSLLGLKLNGEFGNIMSGQLRSELETADANTVVALLGVASLYGFLRVSDLIREVEQVIPGRLLVFFPGTKNENNYRLLDSRDGWNYMANAISLHGEGDLR